MLATTGMATTTSRASLAGASLLSAAASLPLHLIPVIVAVLSVAGRTSVADAGWLASSVSLGQLAASLVLGSFDVVFIGRRHAIWVSLALLAGLAFSESDGFAGLLIGWFVVGACCGTLQYLGTIAAANYSHPAFAFSFRLSVVLVLTGGVVGLLQLTRGLVSYAAMAATLGVVFCLVLGTGISLYRPTKSVRATTAIADGSRSAAILVLISLYLMLVGQSGLLAYVIQNAMGRGIVLADASWALAAIKFSAGIFLLSIAYFGLHRSQISSKLIALGAAVSISDLVVSSTRDAFIFMAGLFGLEIGLNFLSARLQARVVEVSPEFGGQWLIGTMLLGAASGPPLHGAAIGAGHDTVFVAAAILSALVPSAVMLHMRVKLARIPSH